MTSTRLRGLAIAGAALALTFATTACSSPAGHSGPTRLPATPPTSPAATHAQVDGSPTGPTAPATESSNLVTQSDAEALLGGFLIACVPAPAGSTAGPSCVPGCEGPATYPLAGQAAPLPCDKLERGRIYDVNGHYCADDWHLVSSQLVATKANLENYHVQQSIDGLLLQTTRTPVRLIDRAYSQRYYGGQYYYIQIGVVLSPQQISVGKHSLRQFANDGFLKGFDRQIPFTIDRSGTGACADS